MAFEERVQILSYPSVNPRPPVVRYVSRARRILFSAASNINPKGTYLFELSEKLPDLEELMRSIEGYLPVREK